MNCDGFRAKCHDYYLSRLSPAEEQALRGHAAGCPTCGRLMQLADELPCRDFVAFLNEYVAGELAPERRAVFERHLSICRDCTNYLASYRQTLQLTREALAPPPIATESIPPELIQAVLAARKSGRSQPDPPVT